MFDKSGGSMSDSGRKLKINEEHDHVFYSGCAVILGHLVRNGDDILDIMNCNGITLEDLRKAKVDSFDLKPIAKAWRQR